MTTFESTSESSHLTRHLSYTNSPSPAILYNSVVNSPQRAAQVKNTTMFFEDLKANKLPQWMFITPNMTSDAHDTSVTVAGAWLQNFLGPLLDDPNFMQNTMVLITFDENGTFPNLPPNKSVITDSIYRDLLASKPRLQRPTR